MTRTLMITAATIALVIGAAPAFASDYRDNPNHPHHAMKDVIVHPPQTAHGPHVASTHVKYEEQDVSSPAAAEALLGRIKRAAKRVCAPAPHGKRTMQETADYKQCLRDATDEAVQGVNSPALTAAYKD